VFALVGSLGPRSSYFSLIGCLYNTIVCAEKAKKMKNQLSSAVCWRWQNQHNASIKQLLSDILYL